MAELQRQQQSIAARFRELNSQRIKFETLAGRAKEQLKQMTQKKEQKESDLLNTQRFTGQQKARHLA
jgi:flagellar biosynthesis chaperone FliJ